MKRFAIKTATNGDYLRQLVESMQEGEVLEIKEPNRSLEQNAYLWRYLSAFSRQLDWTVMVNGKVQQSKLSEYDWKDLLTGAFEGEARRMAMGIDNTGLVMLGAQTSKYGKRKFSEFIEFLNCFAAQHDVKIG